MDCWFMMRNVLLKQVGDSVKYLSSENTYHHRITDMNTLVSFLPLTIVTFGEEPPKPKGYTARNAYTHSNSDPARGYSV